MALNVVDQYHGNSVVVSGTPSLRLCRDVIYVPTVQQDKDRHINHGLYDQQHRIIPGSGRVVGPNNNHFGPASFSAFNKSRYRKISEKFYYFGYFATHYGHFIVDCLGRLQSFMYLRRKFPNLKLLFHGDVSVDVLLKIDFIKEILDAIDIRPSDFISFNEITEISEVFVQAPAFEELNFCYKSFYEFTHFIGEKIRKIQRGGDSLSSEKIKNKPIYISKSRLISGVSKLINEFMLEEMLIKEGFEVIYPENLTIGEQINLYSQSSILCGFAGSAFHTSLFCAPRQMIILSYDKLMWTNQVLIDKICENNSLYVWSDLIESVGGNESFGNRFNIIDTVRFFDHFMETYSKFHTNFGAADNPDIPDEPDCFGVESQGVRYFPLIVEENIDLMRGDSVTGLVKKVVNPPFRHAIAACARWESRYIVEWLTYYQALGFDHVFLYCNDDDPLPLFRLVEPFTQSEKPFVTFRHHAEQGQQREMYLDFLKQYAHQSEWFGFVDIDEFIRLPPSLTIGQFLARLPADSDAVLFNWVFFGPNGHKTPPDAPVLQAFTRRQAYLHQNTKFLMRSSALTTVTADFDRGEHPFWHRPNPLLREGSRIVNVLGEPAHDYYVGFPDAPLKFINDDERREQIFATALIHHYAFRSEQAFAERAARGTLGSFAGQGMWKELAEGAGFEGFLAAINAIEDLSLANFSATSCSAELRFSDKLNVESKEIDQCLALVDEAKIFSCFQSLGDDCEFALMQRAVGAERLHLLQWASTTPEQLAEMLCNNFSNFANENEISFRESGVDDEIIMFDHVYGLSGHTWISKNEPNLDNKLQNYRKRLLFLKEKLIDDLEDGNYIFLYKNMNQIDNQILSKLIEYFNNCANSYLVIVSRANSESNCVGQARWIGQRVLEAFTHERVSPIWIFDQKGEAWSRLCRAVVRKLADQWWDAPALSDIRSEVNSLNRQGFRFNLALNRPATQSSISEWSIGATVETDAQGAVCGGITGRYRFHTAFEAQPWWRVDLEHDRTIGEVRIFNRLDQPDTAIRSARLAIDIGPDASELVEVYRRDSEEAFGGVDGQPLIVPFNPPTHGRFVRVRLLGTEFLHLDQVQVFGAPDPNARTPIEPTREIAATDPIDQMSARDVLERFQSIGNNCEFGSVQKSLGIGRLSLLQWVESSPQKLIRAIHDNLTVFIDRDDIGVLEDRSEYFWFDPVYGLKSHSFIRVSEMSREDFVKTIRARNRFLVRKFLEELEEGGHIFVYNFFGATLPSLNILSELAAILSRRAPNYLLAVGLPGDYCSEENKVFHFQSGLILATKDIHTSFDSTPAEYRPGWLTICRDALRLLRERDPAFWAAHTERAAALQADTPPVQFAPGNLCQGKKATQSSLSPYSIGRTLEEDASGAINGRIDGQIKFHTDREDSPWWQVDLGAMFGVSQVKIYNRMDVPGVMARAAHLAIEVGFRGDDWVEVYRRENPEPFGGIDGNPLVFAPTIPVPARFVRVRLLRRDYLHLDQVEVFGEKLPENTEQILTNSVGAQRERMEVCIDDRALFSNFISLGLNCEFGIVQKLSGLTKLGLLRSGLID